MRTRTYVNIEEEPKELDAVEKAFDQNVEIAVQEKILHSAEPEGLWYPRIRPPRTSSAYLKRGYASTTHSCAGATRASSEVQSLAIWSCSCPDPSPAPGPVQALSSQVRAWAPNHQGSPQPPG